MTKAAKKGVLLEATFDRRSPVVEEALAQFRRTLTQLKKEQKFDEFVFVSHEDGDLLHVEVFAAMVRKADRRPGKSAAQVADAVEVQAAKKPAAPPSGLKPASGGVGVRGKTPRA